MKLINIKNMKVSKRHFIVNITIIIVVGFILFAASFVNGASSTEYYVSPQGSDLNGNGTLDNPYKTIEKVKNSIRENIKQGLMSNINVYLKGGTYYIDSTINFTEEDAPTNGFNISYKRYKNEVPIILGGTNIDGWSQVPGKPYYKANVPNNLKFNVLLENGKRAVQARYPNVKNGNDTYSKVEKMAQESDRNSSSNNKGFYFKDGDIPNISDIKELELDIWPGGPSGDWMWFEDIHKLNSINYNEKFVQLSTGARYQLGTGSKYFVQNAIELLDAPGEFFLDKNSSTAYYYPYDVKSIKSNQISVANLSTLLAFTGTPEKPVKNITFDGIEMALGNRNGDGFIKMSGVENIQIKNCDIHTTGSVGISMLGYVKKCTIQGNRITDIGAHGILLHSGFSKVKQNEKNIISNNYICDIGIDNGYGSGIQLDNSSYDTIVHNKIMNTTRNSIRMGAMRPHETSLWGNTVDGIKIDSYENARKVSSGAGNIIKYNDCSNANLQGQDTGVIYGWGGGNTAKGEETIVSNNWVHDSNISESFGLGIYLDDATDGTIVEKNIISGLQKKGKGQLNAGFLVRGMDNKINNNFLVDNNVGGTAPSAIQIWNVLVEANKNIEVTKNIIYNSGEGLYDLHLWWYVDEKPIVGQSDRISSSERNLFFNKDKKCMVFGDSGAGDINGWKTIMGNKYDQLTIVTNPYFMDYKNNDFRLRYNSPAYKLGIEDIETSSIGLENEFLYADKKDKLDIVYLKTNKNLEKSFVELPVGGTDKIIPSGRSALGFFDDLKGATITYKSENSKIATVDKNGTVKALSAGITSIIVNVKKGNVKKAKVLNIIVGDELKEIHTIVPRKNLKPGEKGEITVYGITKLGQVKALNKKATFESSVKNVVEVTKEGTFITNSEGSSQITVKVIDGKIQKTYKFAINVMSKMLDTVDTSLGEALLKVGEKTELKVKALMTDGNNADASKLKIEYSSSDPKVASVDKKGLVIGKGEGEAQIKAKVTLNGVTRESECSVTVISE